MENILLSKLTSGFFVPKEDVYINNVTSDSREARENSVFLAIQGERVNGEDYAKAAIEKGVQLVISQNDIAGIEKDKLAVVSSVLDTNIVMAKNYIQNFDIKKIAVTGSVGKTTTKDFIYAAISPFLKTIKSEGNNNNELGLPKTVYKMSKEDKMIVLEMGMTALNDISKLSLATTPDIAVITNIGISHIEHLKTRENILKAKMEICDGLKEDGILILNKDDEFLKTVSTDKIKNVFYYAINDTSADVYAKEIKIKDLTTEFIIVDKNKGEFTAQIPAIGEHNVLNAVCAYLVGVKLGFNNLLVIKNLKDYKISGMRQNIVKKNDIIFIEDCYNASPDSMKASINALVSLKKTRVIAVFGDMLELGENSKDLHFEVGKYAKEKGVDILLTFGKEAENIKNGFSENAFSFKTKGELSEYLIKILNKEDAVIFKASRGMAFEEIIYKVYENK